MLRNSPRKKKGVFKRLLTKGRIDETYFDKEEEIALSGRRRGKHHVCAKRRNPTVFPARKGGGGSF